MNKKGYIYFGILLVVFFSVLLVAHSRVAEIRSSFKHQQSISAPPIPAVMLKFLAGEFKGVVADFFFLEASSFVGGNLANVKTLAWDTVAQLLEQSSALDPYFKQTYTFAQGTLPWYAQKYDQTLALLETSKKHRDWDWIPGFFIGFDYFYFLHDNEAASQALMEASRVEDAPVMLATWAARLASREGQYRAAIDFLYAMYQNTKDENQKKEIEMRMKAVKGALVLQQAVNQFKAKFGSTPQTVQELLEKGIIDDIPAHPYGQHYTLVDGHIEF